MSHDFRNVMYVAESTHRVWTSFRSFKASEGTVLGCGESLADTFCYWVGHNIRHIIMRIVHVAVEIQ